MNPGCVLINEDNYKFGDHYQNEPIVSRKYISEIFVYQTNPMVTQFIGRIGSAMQDRLIFVIVLFCLCRFLKDRYRELYKKRTDGFIDRKTKAM